jgi:hypothetical protein
MNNGLKDLGSQQSLMRDLAPSRQSQSGKEIPWIAEPVTVFGHIETPAYGVANQGLILEYKTPQNYYSLIYGIVLGFIGAPPGPAPLPGDIVFTVDVDIPLGGTRDIGYLEKDFSQVPFSLGNLTLGPLWPVEFRHTNGEILRIKGYTTAHIQTGPTTSLVAAIRGWQWPYGRLD